MISHHHQCIFVHIPKCGGQSVEAVLLEDLGVDRRNAGPFWMLPNANPEVGPPRLAHLTSREYIAHRYVPEALFHSYLTFAVVRNPWSRAISLYRYSAFAGRFADFVTHIAGKPAETWWFFKPQIEYLEIDGQIAVDEILRLERLDAEFAPIRDRLGLTPPLRHLNAGKDRPLRWRDRWRGRRKERRGHWRDYYDAALREAVGEIYARDVEAFGYAFDQDV